MKPLVGALVALLVSCVSTDVPFKPLPYLQKNAFIARIAVVLTEENSAIKYALEKYDAKQNKASISATGEDGKGITEIYDYSDQKIYVINYDSTNTPTDCVITTMSAAQKDDDLNLKQNFRLLGGFNADGLPHLYSSADILYLGYRNLTYKGVDDVDGIPADHWTTVTAWQDDDVQFTLDYYFHNDVWLSAEGTRLISPLRLEIQASKTLQGGKTKNIHRYYDYLDFEPLDGLTPDEFSIPDGVACEHTPPEQHGSVVQMPSKMSYVREIIDTKGNTIESTDVSYDKDLGLLELLYPRAYTLYDFTLGMYYKIDRTGCKMGAIDPTVDSNVGQNGQFAVDIGPVEFSMLGDPYDNAGRRFTRLVNSYSMIGTVNQKPFDIHFAIPDWTFSGKSSHTRPLSMDYQGKHYNFFNFKSGNTMLLNGHISMCTYRQAHIPFVIEFSPRANNAYSRNDIVSGKATANFSRSIAQAAGVSVTRIRMFRIGEWDSVTNRYHLEGGLTEAPPPHYLYRTVGKQSVNREVKVLKSKVLKINNKAAAVKEAALQCESDDSCKNFDLCKTNDGYTMSSFKTLKDNSKLMKNDACDHYARAVDGKPALSLQKAYIQLNDAVEKGRVNVVIKNNANNYYYQSSELTATNIRYKTQGVRVDSKRPIMKFAYFNTNYYSISSTEVISSAKSEDDCATHCLERSTKDCIAFKYCSTKKQCTLSNTKPEERDTKQKNDDCSTFQRLHTANFALTRGKTIEYKGSESYENIPTPNDCAKKCELTEKYKCESFDYCFDSHQCMLSKTHLYSVPPGSVLNSTDFCMHFSRNYLSEFQELLKSHIVPIGKASLQTIAVDGAEQCAYLCRTGSSGSGCIQFDFCLDTQLCQIVTNENSNSVRHVENKLCSTYNLIKPDSKLTARMITQTKTMYSNSSFGGLAFGMVLAGLALGCLVIFVLYKRNLLQRFKV